MITEFSKYKNFKTPIRKPVKGDWIITEYDRLAKIIKVDDDFQKTAYIILYSEVRGDSGRINRKSIKHFGTKEEMETILTANKYNL